MPTTTVKTYANGNLNDINDIPQELIDNPYTTILDHYEHKYPNLGKRIFNIAALQALTPSMPQITVGDQTKRSVLNLILLGNSGSGKTSMVEEIESISRLPELMSKKSAADLEEDLRDPNYNHRNLLFNDARRILDNENMSKAIENVIGDGFIEVSVQNKAETSRRDLQISGVLAGVPADIGNYMSSGILGRCYPITIEYDIDSQKDTGDRIIEGMKENEETVDHQDIVQYYAHLYKEMGHLDAQHIPTFTDYHFPRDKLDTIKKKWKNALDDRNIMSSKYVQWYRELFDMFRIAAAHATLNYYNRDTKNQKLIVQDDDISQGIRLGIIQMKYKTKFLQQERDKIEQLDEYNQSDAAEGLDNTQANYL